MTKRFWFMSYHYAYITQHDRSERLSSTVIHAVHPIDEILRRDREYGKDAWLARGAPTTGSDNSWEEHVLLSFHEIDEDTYHRNLDAMT